MSDPEIPMLRPRPAGLRRTALALAVLGIAGTGIAGAAAWLGGGDTPQPSQPRFVSSSVDLGDGLRCTVTAPAEVQPGGPIGVRFTHENHGTERAEISSYAADAFKLGSSFYVRGVDGREYDTAEQFRRLFISGPPANMIALEPGESYSSSPSGLAVRWGGPLTVTPICSGKDLDPLTIQVANAGVTPSVEEALQRATTAAGIFSNCMPRADGSSVVGTIAPPDGADFAPIQTRCWVEVRRYDGYAVVTFAVLSPPNEPAVPLTEYWFDLPWPSGKPAEKFQWAFVVTQADVRSVDGPGYFATTPSRLVDVNYDWDAGTWKHYNPGRTCGGGTTSGGGIVFFTEAYEPC